MNTTLNQLAYQFMRVNELLVRYWHSHRGINQHKGQGRILAILKMQPEIGQKELGYLLDMSKQSLAELLNKLEKNEYITRTQSEKDRRSFDIKLTNKGREAMPQDNKAFDDMDMIAIFDCLNEEEQNNFLNYLRRITEAFENKSNTDDDSYAEFFRNRFFARHGKHGHSWFFNRFREFYPSIIMNDFGGWNDDTK